MKKYDNIDDIFKEQATGFQINPSDKVWQNIEKEILKSNNHGKRNMLLWALAAILLVIGGYFMWSISSYNHNVNNKLTKDNNIKENNKSELNNNNTYEHKPEIKVSTTISNNNEIFTNNNASTNTTDIVSDNNKREDSIGDYFSTSNEKEINISDYNSGIDLIVSRSIYAIENINSPSIINDFKEASIIKYLERKKRRHFYTGASTSISMTYYSISTDQISWTADLAYGLKLKNYYIESGIGFQKMKEQGVFQIDYKTNDSVGYYNKVVSFEVDPNNPNSITYKTQTTTVYDSIEHQLLESPLYSFDYFVVPIKFGYKFYQKEKISISAEVGVIYSHLTRTYVPNITYNEGDSQLIRISNNTPNRVENNFRVHVAIRLNYNITKSVYLSIQPEFTSYINSIYKQSDNYKSKPYTMGARFGIYYGF